MKGQIWISGWVAATAVFSWLGLAQPPPAIMATVAQEPRILFTEDAPGMQQVPFQGPVTAGELIGTDALIGRLRFVPAGTFIQGSPSTEACRNAAENQFTHRLTRNLAVMETEVTRQMWAVLKAAQSSLVTDPSDAGVSTGVGDPTQNVTWEEAVLFANLLSVQHGLTRAYYLDPSFSTPIQAGNYGSDVIYCNFDAPGYRLPSSGEWEYFARAGTTSVFSIDDPGYSSSSCSSCTSGVLARLESVAWFCANAAKTTHPAGGKTGNPWNLKDIHGSVWEWCWDRHGNNPTGSLTDYQGPATGTSRVLRGGSFVNPASGLRSPMFIAGGRDGRGNAIGFRLVRSLSLLAGQAQGSLDSPKNKATVSGIVAISGWAFIQSGNRGSVVSRAELLVDGRPVLGLDRLKNRPDVQSAFPGITLPTDVGINGTWDSRTVSNGAHTLQLRVVDIANNSSIVATLEVTNQNQCAFFSESFSGSSVNNWRFQSANWAIQNGQLNASQIAGTSRAYAISGNLRALSDFIVDVDVRPSLDPAGGAFGIWPYTTSKTYLPVVDGKVTDGVGAYVNEKGEAFLLFWDPIKNEHWLYNKITLTGPVTSVGMSYTNGAITLRINKQNTSSRFTGNFANAYSLLDTLALFVQGSKSSATFDNVCAEPIFAAATSTTTTTTTTSTQLATTTTTEVPGFAWDVALDGSYAYVAYGSAGLRIFSIANPASPVEVGFYDTPGYAWGVAVAGNYAYVADGTSGLRIVNIANPYSPYEVGLCDTPGTAEEVVLAGNHAYVADSSRGLRIINVANPGAPTEVGSFITPGYATGLYLSGALVYIADYSQGLRIINISNPTAPILAGAIDTPGTAWDVAVAGGLAYIADGPNGLQIIDINNPAQPAWVGVCNTPGEARGVHIAGALAYVADWDGGVRVIDISTPATPAEVGAYGTRGVASAVVVSGNYAYIAAHSGGLQSRLLPAATSTTIPPSTTTSRPPTTTIATTTTQPTTTTVRPTTTTAPTTTTVPTTTTTLPPFYSSMPLPLAIGRSAPCFYIADLTLATGGNSGSFGIELLMNRGRRKLAGGINFGGAFAANGQRESFAAFNISNDRGAPQMVRMELNAQALATTGFIAANLGLRLQVLDADKKTVAGPFYSSYSSQTGGHQLITEVTLNAGFYSLNLVSLSGSPMGTFQLGATTRYGDGGAAEFDGGVVIGGYLTRDPAGNSLQAYAGFCLGEDQEVKINLYHYDGVGPVVLRVKDSDQNIVYDSRNPTTTSTSITWPTTSTTAGPSTTTTRPSTTTTTSGTTTTTLASGEPVQLVLDGCGGPAGGTLRLGVLLNATQPVSSLQFDILFDTGILRFDKIVAGVKATMVDKDVNYSQNGDGNYTIKVERQGNRNPIDNGEIAIIYLRIVLGTPAGTAGAFRIASATAVSPQGPSYSIPGVNTRLSVYDKPVLDYITPEKIAPGGLLRLGGENFGDCVRSVQVLFTGPLPSTNTREENPKTVSSRAIDVQVPSTFSGSYRVQVQVATTRSEQNFTLFVDSSGNTPFGLFTSETETSISLGAGAAPKGAAIDRQSNTAYIPDNLKGAVTAINVRTQQRIGDYPIPGGRPTALAVHSEQRMVLVTSSESNDLTIFKIQSDGALGISGAPVRVGQTPLGVAVDPRTNLAFVANWDSDYCSVVDLTKGKEIKQIAVGRGAISVAVIPGHQRAFVVNNLKDEVYPIDTDKLVPLDAISLPPGVRPRAIGTHPESGTVLVGSEKGLMIYDVGSRQSDFVLNGQRIDEVAVHATRGTANLVDNNNQTLKTIDVQAFRKDPARPIIGTVPLKNLSVSGVSLNSLTHQGVLTHSQATGGNGAPEQGGSAGFSRLSVAPSLNFPRLFLRPQDANFRIALANPSSLPGSLQLSAMDASGRLVQAMGVDNPFVDTLPTKGQHFEETSSPVGRTLNAASEIWIKLTAPNSGLRAFFLSGDLTNSMVGADESGVVLQNAILPAIRPGYQNWISLINPGIMNAPAKIHLRPDGGGNSLETRDVNIPARGMLQGRVEELLPSGWRNIQSGAYIQVECLLGLRAFQLFAPAGGLDPAGLNSQSAVTGPSLLDFAHFVAGGGYGTLVGIVNLEAQPVQLKWTLTLDGGNSPAPVVRQLGAFGRTEQDIGALFGLGTGNSNEGWLRVETDGGSRLAGYLTYASSTALAAVAPLAEPRTQLTFSHVQETDTDLYTGLALLNANDTPAEIKMTVFTTNGSEVASVSRTIPGRGRIRQLLREIFGNVVLGQKGGYVMVTSSMPIHGIEIFGNRGDRAMANIPAQ